MEAFQLSWKQLAAVGTGVFVGLTAVGYIHDNFWDPTKRSSRKSNFKRPPAPKTALELENPGLVGESLFKKLIQTGEHLETQKKYEEAEKYFLRLYDLAKEEAARSPEVGPMIFSFVLHYLVKNYRAQKRWDLAEHALNEMLTFTEAIQEPEYSEWKLALVDVLIRLKKYQDALDEAEGTKNNLKKMQDAPGQEGRVKLLQFMAHEKLAEIYRILGKLDNAESELKNALSIHIPSLSNRSLQLELDLAAVNLQKGERKKAEEIFENLNKRPEIRNSKNKFLQKRLVGSCYYDANMLESAEKLFSEIVAETGPENEQNVANKTDYEQALNFLATIAHERLSSDKARKLYHSIKQQTDMYAYTTSRYFQTTEAKFNEITKASNGNVRGVWNISLEIRKFFLKGVPHLAPGNHLVILTESLEESQESKSKGKEEAEFVDSSGLSLNIKKSELTLTQAHLDQETFAFDTPEIEIATSRKILIEVHIFSNSSQKQLLGIHHQLVCLLEKKPSNISPEILKQFQQFL